MTVLVIGEHKFLRSTLCAWLKAMIPACHPVEAAGAAEGINFAQQSDPQAIIIDVGFPSLSSLGDIANIKTAAPSVPLVALTSYDFAAYRAEALAAGASACISKEAIFTQLQPLLAGLLSGQYQDIPG